MKVSFALKRPGAQESSKSVKRASIGHSNGTKIRAKRRQNQPKWANGSQKRPPPGETCGFYVPKGQFLGSFWEPFLNQLLHKIDTKKHWKFDTKKHVFLMLKLCQKDAKIDAQMHQTSNQKQTQKQRVKTCKNMTFRRAENALIYRKGHRIWRCRRLSVRPGISSKNLKHETKNMDKIDEKSMQKLCLKLRC